MQKQFVNFCIKVIKNSIPLNFSPNPQLATANFNSLSYPPPSAPLRPYRSLPPHTPTLSRSATPHSHHSSASATLSSFHPFLPPFTHYSFFYFLLFFSLNTPTSHTLSFFHPLLPPPPPFSGA